MNALSNAEFSAARGDEHADLKLSMQAYAQAQAWALVSIARSLSIVVDKLNEQ